MNFATRAEPHLMIVGEALDIEAPCGGYNLSWAWLSGLIAATQLITSTTDTVSPEQLA